MNHLSFDPSSCHQLEYPAQLPTTSIVIPFYNEWPSVILRTVYSIVNRTPRQFLKEIILMDDASDLGWFFNFYLRECYYWNAP